MRSRDPSRGLSSRAQAGRRRLACSSSACAHRDLTAFSTSSSNATLPTALRVSEANLGVPSEIGAFVLTVGATANQNGTALYEGATVLFLAQLAGADLTMTQQLMVVYLAVLGSIGTAGVPAGSIPFVVPSGRSGSPRPDRDYSRR